MVGILALSCSETVAPGGRGLTALQADTHTATGDAASVVNLTAMVDTTELTPGSTVTFTTSLGTLAGTAATVTVPVDSTGTVRAQLHAPSDAGLARITATLGVQVRMDSVIFVRALADQIILSVDRVSLKTDARVLKITATLARAVGAPSPGQLVTFAAYTPGNVQQARGNLIPAVAPVVSGAATTTLFADTAATGPVRIRAQIAGSQGVIVTDSTLVQVIP